MKILVLSSLFPNAMQPRHGIFIEHRIAHLARPGDEIHVVAPVPWFPIRHRAFGRYACFAGAPKRDTRRGIVTHYPRYPVLPKIGMSAAPWLMIAALYPFVAALRRTFDFDVIDSYYLYPDGVAASLLAQAFDRPFLMSALGSDVSLIPQYHLPRRMILNAIDRAASVTTVCGALRDELAAIGASPGRMSVIEHGVDLDLFSPPHNREQLRSKLGLSGPTVISVGHLIDRKGHDLAIRAIRQLPGVCLLIVGDGPEEQSLRSLAHGLGVADRVRFLGHVGQARLPDLYGAADVAINCSDREGIANVLLEALACGTPLVATPVWGSPEVIQVPEAGVLSGNRSAEAIQEALFRLLSNLPKRSATRAYALRYDWRETGRQHRQALALAVESKSFR
ncbi:glycosyltransferase [Sphingomonas sp.]|uniref:glycosyltransferase n=1 Tax=Sphingomonas sp. TaxID=28214 RepID=UPI00289C3F7A|nr:glycosyltransferase [Sphingomonas sp.]